MITNQTSDQWLNNLPATIKELKEIQKAGKDNLSRNRFPSKSQEEWRLTNLKRLEQTLRLKVCEGKGKNKQLNIDNFSNLSTNRFKILFDPYENNFDNLNLPEGIELLSIKETKKYLGKTLTECKCNDDWPIAINNSSINTILGLKVKSQEIPDIELLIPSEKNLFSSSRVLIYLEENANLDLLQVILGSEKSAQSNIVEIIMEEGSSLNHSLISNGGNEEASLLSHIATQQEVNSDYSLTFVQSDWSLSRFEPRVVQTKGNAKTNLKGLQLCNGSNQIATHSFVRFNGPNGRLDQLQKAIANNKAHSIFNGIIEVPRAAQQTKAEQLSRNLILSKRARIDTKPELEIVADDVRCTHGATVSQLQEEELFYLRSRGINREEANSLLLKGYCQEIINNLSIENNSIKELNDLLIKL